MPKAKPLSRQAKEMVLSLVEYFERERNSGGALLPLQSVRERVADALKLHVSTVNRLSAKRNVDGVVRSPKKPGPSRKPVTVVDSSVQVAIRDVIYDMYKQKDQPVTISNLLKKLKDRYIFTGCRTSLWKVLNNIGFKWKKDNPRRGLMELNYIASKRVHLLSNYMQYKNAGLYKFVFLDETWIFQNGTIAHSWQDDDVRSVKSTKVEGKRYIILHAGNVDGFIHGAELVFSSATKHADYHGEMNSANFLQWFENQLLKHLEEPSVIIMDNASYHSTLKNKCPTAATKKSDIQQWLTTNSIPFEAEMLKPQLLQKVLDNKPPKVYEADTLAEFYGHKVLRLPPYHCIFNAIEQVWGITKSYYNKHVGREGSQVEHCIDLWKEALQQVGPNVWSNCIRHTEGEIQKWWDRERHMDQQGISPLIINNESGSEDDCSDDEESDS